MEKHYHYEVFYCTSTTVRVKAYTPANGQWTATGFTLQGGSFDSNVENLFVIFDGNICIPPSSGTWTITTSCTMSASTTVPGNIIIQNNSILTVPSGISLNIDFIHNNLIVESGGKIS